MSDVTEEKLSVNGETEAIGPPLEGTDLPFPSLRTVARIKCKTGAKRVLIVEDDPLTLAAMEKVFGRCGCKVLSASTVAEGIRLLDQHPDCLVLDLSLPDGLGLEVLVRVRQRKIPLCIAVTTGSVDPLLLEAAESMQPDVLLRKPVEVQRLLATFGVKLARASE